MNILSYLLGLLPSLITGIILFYVQRRQKKIDSSMEERSKNRKRESLILIDLQLATAKLSYATAMAIKRGTANGEVEEGIKAYRKALVEFQEFEREQISGL